MKRKNLSIIFAFIILTSILSSCCSSSKVSSTSTFQKRKYNKGWHINTRAKASNLTNPNTNAKLINEEQDKVTYIKDNKLKNTAKMPEQQLKETKNTTKSDIGYNNVETLSASTDNSSINIPKKNSVLITKSNDIEEKTIENISTKRQIKDQEPNVNPYNKNESSAFATAGFILALIGAGFGWIPILGWSICITGIVFSFIGVFRRKRRGLAIAGLVISTVTFLTWLALTLFVISVGFNY